MIKVVWATPVACSVNSIKPLKRVRLPDGYVSFVYEFDHPSYEIMFPIMTTVQYGFVAFCVEESRTNLL